MRDILRSITPLRKRAFAKMKSVFHDVIHHERTKKFFDHNSSTAWKGAIAACVVTVLLVWYPLAYIAAVIQYCVRGPIGDFLMERIYNPIFREESELVPGMFTLKEGDFYEFAEEPVRVFLFSLIDSSDLVMIAIALYLFRKKLRQGLLKLTAKLPEHFRAYSIVITTTAVFTFGWAAVRSPYPFIFGIVWNFLFPALVGILTWFTIQKQDFLIDKSKAIMELREKIPAKFRILVLFGFTLLLTYILMAIMPNKGTQFKEQLIVLISVFLGWLLSVEYSTQKAEGEKPSKSLLSSLAIAILFIIVITPLGAADPSECCHPHDELEADEYYPGEIYPTTQGTIIGIFGCGIGANIHFLIKPSGPKEETGKGDLSDSESGTNSEEGSGFISILADTWKGIKQEFSEAADQIGDFTQEAGNVIRDGQFWIDTVTGSLKTIYDTSDRLVNKTSGEDIVEGAKKVGNTIVKIGEYAMDKPVEFLLSLTPLEALENSFDPDKTLIERMGNLTIVYLEGVGVVLSGGTIGGVKAGGKILILGENADDVRDLQRLVNENNGDIKIGKQTVRPKGKKLKDLKQKSEPRKKLTPESIEERKADWQKSLGKAESRLQDYADALESGDNDLIDKAMIEMKRDKIAMRLANIDLPDAKKQIFNQRTNDLHMKVDTDVKDYVKEHFNLGEMKGPVQTSEGKVWTNPDTKEQFIAVETTNPTSVVKIGSDRDITYRVVKLDENGQLVKSDIDHRFVRPEYEKSYHTNSRAKELGYKETHEEFTYNSDQAVTSQRHTEAFGDGIVEGDNIVQRRLPSAKPDDSANTSSFKHNHWSNKGTPGSEFEALRNLGKLQESRHEPFVNQLRELNPDHHLLKERVVDGNMAQKMGTRRSGAILEEIRKLREDPRNSKSPVEIEKMVRDEGFTDMNEFAQHVNYKTAAIEEAVKYENMQRGLER
tara:strand:- start:2286 stop:5108 length:2823 start_codon:yes stop_codon:yes gene_type:complete